MEAGNKNILYYNAIAREYNDMVDKDPDRIIREKVAQKFCSIVKALLCLTLVGVQV